MMNKNTTSIVYGIVLAAPFAMVVTGVVDAFRPGLHTATITLLLIGFWVAFSVTGVWTLNRKFPLSAARNIAEPERNFTIG